MPNNQAHDPRVVDPVDRVAAAVGLSVARVNVELGQVSIINETEFNDGTPGEWQTYTSATGSLDFSQGVARGIIPEVTGASDRGTHVNMTYEIYEDGQAPSEDIFEIFAEFDARMPEGAKGGIKFFKIFGIRTDDQGNVENQTLPNFANTTIGLWYTNGELQAVSWGDGEDPVNNDTTSIANLDGQNHVLGRAESLGAEVTAPMGRAFGVSDWGTGMHNFKFRVRFNSGTTAQNEKNDGLAEVYIDNKLWLRVDKIFNRHWSNRGIYAVKFFGWANGPCPSFTLDYANARLTTGDWYKAPLISEVDFETGDFSHALFGQSIPSNCVVSSDNSHTGTYAAKFSFAGSPGDTDSQAQRNFTLDDEYTNVEVEFDLYIPDGTEPWGGAAYAHRDPGSATNNKFLRLWSDNGINSGNNGYDSLEKVGASLVRGSDSTRSDLTIQAKNASVGEWLGDIATVTDFITATDQGKWMNVRFMIQQPTGDGSNDGRILIYKNSQLVASVALNNWTAAEQHAYQHGYLLGYANSGFDTDTHLFIDNLVFRGESA